MPPKRGKKRKAAEADEANGDAPLAPPDRATWPGWVEMESEPAFFNVMLKEMGVQGVKIQEVYGLDEEMLAILPQPVHALIFLFRYKDTDQAVQDKDATCPKHIWFANQVPDFACASVALLNIVNNIEGLQMGNELQNFKIFTQDMDPLRRGDAIDGFDFVKHIHNSFARDNDLLIADMHMQQKATKTKKKQALAKARETREAKKVAKETLLQEKAAKTSSTPTKSSARAKKKTEKSKKASSPDDDDSSLLSDAPDDADFDTPSRSKKPTNKATEAPRRSGRAPKPRKDTFAASAAAAAEEAEEEGFHFIAYMSIQGHVWKLDGLDSFPQDIGEYDSAGGGDWMNVAQPNLQARMAMYEGTDIEFNLMAVVHNPLVKEREELMRNVRALRAIDKKLDGVSSEWRSLEGGETKKEVITGPDEAFGVEEADLDIVEVSAEAAHETTESAKPAPGTQDEPDKAQPQSNGADPAEEPAADIPEENAAPTETTSPTTETDGTTETTHPATTSASQETDAPTAPTLKSSHPPTHPNDTTKPLDTPTTTPAQASQQEEPDLLTLLAQRRELIAAQAPLRAAVRDSLESAKGDEEKARHRRHDYGGFVRGWLGALAEEGVLGGLLEGE